jgi:hypothetical protein
MRITLHIVKDNIKTDYELKEGKLSEIEGNIVVSDDNQMFINTVDEKENVKTVFYMDI